MSLRENAERCLIVNPTFNDPAGRQGKFGEIEDWLDEHGQKVLIEFEKNDFGIYNTTDTLSLKGFNICVDHLVAQNHDLDIKDFKLLCKISDLLYTMHYDGFRVLNKTYSLALTNKKVLDLITFPTSDLFARHRERDLENLKAGIKPIG